MTDTTKRALGIIIVASVTLRLAVALFLGDEVVALPGTFDQISYHTLALRLLDGEGFSFGTLWWPLTGAGEPTAHWSYLYTLFLAGIYWLFGPQPLIARLLQAALVGVMQPVLAYALGRRIATERVGLVAAFVTGFYIYFIYYAGSLMTEAFYITGILAVLYLTMVLQDEQNRQRTTLAVCLGVVIGVTILLRQLFLLFIPFLLLWWWGSRYQCSRQLPIRLTALVLLVGAFLILPVTAYNYARFNQFVLLNTNAGYAFFWANHPIHGTTFQPILPQAMGSYQDLIPEELRHLNEAALDQALLKRGLDFVIEDPGRYLSLSLSRIPEYFTFWPSADSGAISNLARTASFGLMWPFMVAGTLLIVVRQRANLLFHPASLLLLFVAVYTAIHLLSWALIRYRLPVDAVMLVFAGLALVELAAWLQRRRVMATERSQLPGY
jgi:4-amino-4-deoxy-L-arabinose transferase-like glycosyltransferase